MPIDQFGIAVFTAEGQMILAGDAETPFSIQSISKVFTLDARTRQGRRHGSGIGSAASRRAIAFNSIVQLEYENGKPRNPFINAGAIAVTDTLLAGHEPREVLGEILRLRPLHRRR